MSYSNLITSAEVYAVLMARHRDQMSLFESFSDPDGTFNGGPGIRGRMETTWGIAGADYPLMRIVSTWDIDPTQPHKRVDQAHQYFLCITEKEEE